MKTYIEIVFNSEGSAPLDVVQVFEKVGFTTSYGQHDFVFNWEKDEPIATVLNLLNKLHDRLKGMNVSYTATTVL